MIASLVLTLVVALGFVATVVCGLVAATSWLVTGRLPKWPLGLAGASLAMAMLVCTALPPGYDDREAGRIQALHAEFAPVLERYRQEYGTYPPTLQAAGIATPQTPWGPLRYKVFTDREGKPYYEVSMGDYAKNGFVSFWTSESPGRGWSIDS